MLGRIHFHLACAYFVMVALILGFGAALAYLAFRLALSRFGLMLLLALLAYGCAHPQPAPQPSGPITEVILPAHVPGWAKFCIEDLYMSMPDDEVFIRRTMTVCAWTVDDIRKWAVKQKAADE